MSSGFESFWVSRDKKLNVGILQSEKQLTLYSICCGSEPRWSENFRRFICSYCARDMGASRADEAYSNVIALRQDSTCNMFVENWVRHWLGDDTVTVDISWVAEI